jgi:hypothetical protein
MHMLLWISSFLIVSKTSDLKLYTHATDCMNRQAEPARGSDTEAFGAAG